METNNFFYQAAEFFEEYNKIKDENFCLKNQINDLLSEVETIELERNSYRDLYYNLKSNSDGSQWISVDDDEKPLDSELIAVQPKNGNPRFGTFIRGQFDQKDIVAWLRLPKYKK